MTFTPTTKGSFLAGIGLWLMLWLGLFKIDELVGDTRGIFRILGALVTLHPLDIPTSQHNPARYRARKLWHAWGQSA